MKKNLLGLIVALLTFVGGILMGQLFYIGEKQISDVKRKPIQAGQTEFEESESFGANPGGVYLPNGKRYMKTETALILTVFDNESGQRETRVSLRVGDKFYVSISGNAAAKDFFFQTEIKNGVSYRFKGSFFKDGFKEQFIDDVTVLHGSLEKWENNKKVSDRMDYYSYYAGICSWLPGNQ